MTISLILDLEPSFELKIQKGLRKKCEELTGINEDSKKLSISAKQNEKTIGGLISYLHGPILWLDSIYIEEEHQKKGIGRMMIESLSAHAKQSNIDEIQLNTYFPEAYDFFTRCGFETVAHLSNWKYGLTCYFMRKTLEKS